MFKDLRVLSWFFLSLQLLGCTSTINLEIAPPKNYVLEGNWHLLPMQSSKPPKPEVLRSRGFILSMVVEDFPLIRTQRMEIEQSSDSIGIFYDKKMYRDVTWGVRSKGLWEVHAGWNEEGNLVIFSSAKDAKAKEVFQLNSTGSELTITIEITADSHNLSLTRKFRKMK